MRAHGSVRCGHEHRLDPHAHRSAGSPRSRPRRSASTRPVPGLRAGIRTDAAWRSWRLIAADWEQRLRGRRRRRRHDGRDPRAGRPDRRRRPQPHRRARGGGRLRDRRARHLRVVHDVRDRGRGGDRSSAERPVVAVVTEEFATHGAQHGQAPRSRRPRGCSCCRTRSKRGPRTSCSRSRPSTTRRRSSCSGCSRDARPASRSRSPPIRRVLRAVARRAAGATACRCCPPTDDAIEALLAAHAGPGRPRGGRAAAAARRRDRRAGRGQRGDGRRASPTAFPLVLAALEALLEPEWNAFGLTTTTSSVFPMLIVNGPSPRRRSASTTAPAAWAAPAGAAR